MACFNCNIPITTDREPSYACAVFNETDLAESGQCIVCKEFFCDEHLHCFIDDDEPAFYVRHFCQACINRNNASVEKDCADRVYRWNKHYGCIGKMCAHVINALCHRSATA